MPNGTTTKVAVKTSTVVGVLLAGGAIAAAAFIAGNRFGTPRGTQPLTVPTQLINSPCALTCAEVAPKCCPTSSPTVTPVTPPLQTLTLCDRANPQPVPNLIVHDIIPGAARTEVVIGNTGLAPLTPSQSFKVKLEKQGTGGTWIEVQTMPVTGEPGQRSTLGFRAVPGANWLKATIDSENSINEYGWIGGEFPECLDGERDNVKEWQTVL